MFKCQYKMKILYQNTIDTLLFVDKFQYSRFNFMKHTKKVTILNVT